jgi:hypothetical protein
MIPMWGSIRPGPHGMQECWCGQILRGMKCTSWFFLFPHIQESDIVGEVG